MPMRTTRSAAARKHGANPSSTDTKNPLPEPQQLSSPPSTPAPPKESPAKRKIPTSVKKEAVIEGNARTTPAMPNSSRKRSRRATIKEEEEEAEESHELPHNLGTKIRQQKVDTLDEPQPATKKTKTRAPKKEKKVELTPVNDAQSMAEKAANQSPSVAPSSAKKSKKAKTNNYGLTPGSSPYPDWPHPTPEECEEVTRVLSKLHGKIVPPKSIPLPSLNVSGCGEVPSVLDALIRTRLSAATSGTNSSRAFKGLVDNFGTLKEGIGKGSVNWDAVRRADQKDIFNAIKSGGLADVKSKDIKSILQMVYEENQARGDALKSEQEAEDQSLGPLGANSEPIDEKKAEMTRAESNVLSLDHLHLLSNDDAFNALVKFPGIGPKTASCVLLFCLQRPSFAVDTHVFRLCKWLGWVPPDKATRNSTYAHCEVRVPDNLKYPLHQLLIRHGKSCPRCRAATGEGSRDWDEGCVIDHLVERDGKRKGNRDDRPVMKGKKKQKMVESEEESSELSDFGDEEELSE